MKFNSANILFTPTPYFAGINIIKTPVTNYSAVRSWSHIGYSGVFRVNPYKVVPPSCINFGAEGC